LRSRHAGGSHSCHEHRRLPPPDGVIDFTVPSELKELVTRVRVFVAEDVLPAESEIGNVMFERGRDLGAGG